MRDHDPLHSSAQLLRFYLACQPFHLFFYRRRIDRRRSRMGIQIYDSFLFPPNPFWGIDVNILGLFMQNHQLPQCGKRCNPLITLAFLEISQPFFSVQAPVLFFLLQKDFHLSLLLFDCFLGLPEP